MKGRFTLKGENYDQLIDSPFELAEQSRFSFEANGIPHEFVISGKHAMNLETFKNRYSKKFVRLKLRCLVQHHSNYTFMTMATGNSYGGLEHCNSTSLITPRDDLPKENETQEPSKDYQRFLGFM